MVRFERLQQWMTAGRRAGARIRSIAGSLAVNLAILGLVAASLAATPANRDVPPPLMTVVLVSPPPEPPTVQTVSATPLRREAAPRRRHRDKVEPAPLPQSDPEAEAIGRASPVPPPVGPVPPAGLGRLLADDPCVTLAPRDRPAGCRTGWGDRVAAVPKALARRIEKTVAAERLASVDQPDCGSRHLGCTPIPDKTLIGTRPADRSMAAGGPTGTDGLVGRLPPPNAYHVDPGFGD